jgi:hypothetical protein
MTPLSPPTLQRLQILFSAHDHDEAERLLVQSCGDNLPGCRGSGPRGMERIRYAALKLSGGNMVRLRQAVDLAAEDGRDLLVAAGLVRTS